MFEMILVFGAGLIVGWNFLPQPAMIRNAVSTIFGTGK